MGQFSQINAVIEAYTDWARPWMFYDSVVAIERLADDERSLITAIWSEGCNERHWSDGSLPEGSAAAELALEQSFPALSAKARSRVVRAAAYQWK